MDISKYATFVDLAQTLSYTKTAERRYTSQATVSKQILALEKELGETLIDRSRRQIALTWAGELVLPYAKQLVTTENALVADLQRHQHQKEMSLTIHSIPSIAQYRAFNSIAAFTHQHPEVDLHFAEAETATLLPSLKQGQSDVVFTRIFGQLSSDYDVQVGDTDRFVAVIPINDPLANAAELTMAQLKSQSFLLLDEQTGLYEPVMSMIHSAGIDPKIVYKGKRIDLILGMVSRGMGISIMMEKSLDLSDLPAVKTVPLMTEERSQLAFVRIKGVHTAASQLFWQFLADQEK